MSTAISKKVILGHTPGGNVGQICGDENPLSSEASDKSNI